MQQPIQVYSGVIDFFKDTFDSASKIPGQIIDFGYDLSEQFADFGRDLQGSTGGFEQNIRETETRRAGDKIVNWLKDPINLAITVAAIAGLLFAFKKL